MFWESRYLRIEVEPSAIMVCLFKKKEITTAYLVESKEQTVKNQGPLLNATLAVIVLKR